VEHRTRAWMPNGNIEAVLRKRPEQDEDMVLAQESLQKGALQKISELAPFYALIRRGRSGSLSRSEHHTGAFSTVCANWANGNATIVSITTRGKVRGVIWADDPGFGRTEGPVSG